MPIYEYQAADLNHSCPYCAHLFEEMQRLADPVLQVCPRCKSPVIKLISAPSVGASASGFDDRAKSAGFQKLRRLGKGEYEKEY
ncbi:MAG: zinc ribbon domain-containing protein [Verrucomicrobia bacterium]|nr:zinc ribbon domain-containing protein [Verrucomicrobiota bacterium]